MGDVAFQLLERLKPVDKRQVQRVAFNKHQGVASHNSCAPEDQTISEGLKRLNFLLSQSVEALEVMDSKGKYIS